MLRVSNRSRAGVLSLATVALALTACSADATGQIGLAVDPAGRLLALVALCDGQRIGSLTLTDETSGTTVTVRPKDSPPSGTTIILTGPVGDPHPEGVFDLLDRAHDYSLSATTTNADQEETGTLAPVRFRLDTVVKESKLRTGAVLTSSSTDGALINKATYLATAAEAC